MLKPILVYYILLSSNMFSIFTTLQTIIRSYHKDKDTQLFDTFTTYITRNDLPNRIRFHSWKHEFKVDIVTHKLHSFLFYQKDNITIPDSVLFESIAYIITFYPHDSPERFDCLDYVVDKIEHEASTKYAILLYEKGSLDEQLYAKNKLKTEHNQNDIEDELYSDEEICDYNVVYAVHTMLFNIPISERNRVLEYDIESIHDFIFFYDVVDEINKKYNREYTEEQLVQLIMS
jgi:hypothetical protein